MLAFAGIGIGYGVVRWTDNVVVHGIVDSTSFKVGLRAVGTDDPDNWRDPVYNESSKKVERQDYRVGSTSISNDYNTWKFSIYWNGKWYGYYGKLHVRMQHVYPNYAPTIEFRVGVSPDSPPAKIAGFMTDFTEKDSSGNEVAKGNITIDNNGVYHYEWWNNQPPTTNTIVYNPDPNIKGPNMDIVSYTIVYDKEYTGDCLPKLMQDLEQITIKPGTSASISITLRFTNIPESHYLDGNITAIFEQALPQ